MGASSDEGAIRMQSWQCVASGSLGASLGCPAPQVYYGDKLPNVVLNQRLLHGLFGSGASPYKPQDEGDEHGQQSVDAAA